MRTGIPSRRRKKRVEKRLTHEMKVQIIRVGAQFGHQGGEFLHGHNVLLPLRARAEGAGQVAYIGYFQIDLIEAFHVNTPFFL